MFVSDVPGVAIFHWIYIYGMVVGGSDMYLSQEQGFAIFFEVLRRFDCWIVGVTITY